jgi:hypothetical protein
MWAKARMVNVDTKKLEAIKAENSGFIELLKIQAQL